MVPTGWAPWGGSNRSLFGPCMTSISATRITLLFLSCQFYSGWWQRLDNINWLVHFVCLVVQCLIYDGYFFESVNMRNMNLHTLHPLPYVHPHARTSHQVHPNTQRDQEVYSNLYAQKTERENYLEDSSNDYHSPHLLYSVRSISKHVLFLIFYRVLMKVNVYL